jgi:hypothetical protein
MRTKTRFELGRTVTTPTAESGVLNDSDQRANESVVKHCDRPSSAYHLTTGRKIYVISEFVLSDYY